MNRLQKRIAKRHKLAKAYKITAGCVMVCCFALMVYIQQTMTNLFALVLLIGIGAIVLALAFSLNKVEKYVDQADVNDVAAYEKHLIAKAYCKRELAKIKSEPTENCTPRKLTVKMFDTNIISDNTIKVKGAYNREV